MRIIRYSCATLITAALILAAAAAADAQGDTLAAQLGPVRAVIHEIRFLRNTDRIVPASDAHIERLAQLLFALPDTFLIEGHTDATGNPAADQALSEKRAAVVKSRLMAAGVSGVRLFVAGFGAARPLTNSNGEAPGRRQRNERIEMVKVHWEPAVDIDPSG